ncbi:MAG: DNA primase [Gemmataceae bacterium]
MTDDWATLIQQVKEASDIVDVVGGYVSLRQVGPTFKGLCPFHDDHRPSFDVDPRRQRYRCWACNKFGDVISFIQEHERVDFREALELLARRAGITLEKIAGRPQNSSRAGMIEVMRWVAAQYHELLLEGPQADVARRYLGERRLSGETVRRFGLGYAPASGDWLHRKAVQAGQSLDLLEKLGLLARRTNAEGFYDRFRDRVMFPIRDGRGQTVGFGGRILPSSPYVERAPKYYNSCDTPLFTKSEHLYGLDLARQAGAQAGYLAVVEGYTDVLMAHQCGIPQVVATMGTALNARHVRHLRRFVPRVVLVFDADAGGLTGVDRALEIFVSQDVDLAIATLPEGLDPCDLLTQQGPEPFRQALAQAVDALEFKLNQVLAKEAHQGVEGRRRALEALLGVIALAPDLSGEAGAVRRELVVSRIAQRLGIKEETVWGRLRELKAQRQTADIGQRHAAAEGRQTSAPAPAHEVQLLQVLLAEPALVPEAALEILPDQLRHPGLRRLLAGLYLLQAEGEPPELDLLRARIDNPRLATKALELQELGRMHADRAGWLRQLLAEFRRRRLLSQNQAIQHQLQAAQDHAQAVELLRQFRK